MKDVHRRRKSAADEHYYFPPSEFGVIWNNPNLAIWLLIRQPDALCEGQSVAPPRAQLAAVE